MKDKHKAILFISGIALFAALIIGGVIAFALTKGKKEDIPQVDWNMQSDSYKPHQVEPRSNQSQNMSNF